MFQRGRSTTNQVGSTNQNLGMGWDGWIRTDLRVLYHQIEKKEMSTKKFTGIQGDTVEMIQVNFFSAANCSRSVGQTGEIDTSKPRWTMR